MLVGAFLVIALVGLLQVVQTSGATTTGYSLQTPGAGAARAQAQVHQLEAEVAALTSIERIESEARGRLGMVPPAARGDAGGAQATRRRSSSCPQRYFSEAEEPTPKTRFLAAEAA